jgi:hypothetical protein
MISIKRIGHLAEQTPVDGPRPLSGLADVSTGGAGSSRAGCLSAIAFEQANRSLATTLHPTLIHSH